MKNKVIIVSVLFAVNKVLILKPSHNLNDLNGLNSKEIKGTMFKKVWLDLNFNKNVVSTRGIKIPMTT